MKIASVKETLINQINILSQNTSLFCKNPNQDFTRNRKLSFKETILIILAMKGSSLTNELLDYFEFNADTVTSSAFVQQRGKICPRAFEELFRAFSNNTNFNMNNNTYKGYRFFAVDGSDIQIATNKEDADSYFPGANGQKPYNLIHLNAMYDLQNHIYSDAIIQGRYSCNEGDALIQMVERSNVKEAIVTADRGYESYNVMAHIEEKGWKYLIRIKNEKGIALGLTLPDSEEFDIDISLKMTRSYSNEIKHLCQNRNEYRYVPTGCRFDYLPMLNNQRKTKPLFYTLDYRILRIKISDELTETIVTNLSRDEFSPSEIKKMYSIRWGIETSFRSLKYTVGMIHFHTKKADCILQEIYASLIMYNFTELVTSSVVIKTAKRKFAYKANFSVAVHICREFLKKNIHPPNVEAIIAKNILPIRENRKYARHLASKRRHAICFIYRVA